jgi:hypothetical protein
MLHRTRLRPPQSCGDHRGVVPGATEHHDRGRGAGSALYGYALKAHVATWPGMSAVLQDAAHSAR